MVEESPEFKRALHALAETVGIETSYWDIFGRQSVATVGALRAALTAMGFEVGSEESCLRARRDLDEAAFLRIVPAVSVLRRGSPFGVSLCVPRAMAGQSVPWSLRLENGPERRGEWRLDEAEIREVRECAVGMIARFDVEIPGDLPDGYHELTVFPGIEREGSGLVVLAPAACWLPDCLNDGGKGWGISCQVYALRSSGDWGVGDFGALAALAEAGGRQGADMIGVNPLHALFPMRPDMISPYSPSSRLHLNPLCIAVEDVPEFAADAALQETFAAEALQRRLEKVRNEAFVDYETVGGIKRWFLERLFEVFEASAPSARRQDFERFCAEGGERLRLFAAFQVLEQMHAPHPWPEWPEAHRNVRSPEIGAFIREREHDVRREMWLQFEADRQLSRVSDALRSSGGRIGLYRDLAVGVNPHGADAWIDPEIFVTAASVGAPPDALGPWGQVWGLPPVHPIRLAEQKYASFIDVLRANMRHAGALRIDHVMGLQHQFWVPCGMAGTEGLYVRYPLDDLLGILALESHRRKCLIIGEDLGTVPDGLRTRMAHEKLLSYRVFFFERWESGLYRRPDNYPHQAVACATSHDMTPIAGFWRGWDIELRHALGLVDEDATPEKDQAQRAQDRQMLKAALIDQYMIPADFPESGLIDEMQERDLILSIHSFLAASPSALVMLNLDDVAGEVSAVNIPGTLNEYPNWRRRLRETVKELAESDRLRLNAAVLARRRNR